MEGVLIMGSDKFFYSSNSIFAICMKLIFHIQITKCHRFDITNDRREKNDYNAELLSRRFESDDSFFI